MEIKEEVLKNEKVEGRTAEEMTADFEEAVQEARNLPGGICGYIVLAIGRKHEDKKGRPATICVNGKTDDLAFDVFRDRKDQTVLLFEFKIIMT